MFFSIISHTIISFLDKIPENFEAITHAHDHQLMHVPGIVR